jgi:pilus assembly protein CpaE
MLDNNEPEGGFGPYASLFGPPPPSDEMAMAIRNELRADQKVDVLLVTRDADLKEKFVEVFTEKDRFALRVLNARVSDFENVFRDIQVPELLVVDLDKASIIDTEALERIKKSKFESTPMLVLSNYLDQDTVRSLVRIKVDDWLPSDCSSVDIYKSCERALRKPAAETPVHDAVCHTFFPVSGGCGNTTLAIQAAFLLGRQKAQLERTCLVDLNFQDGTVADYLDLVPSFKIEELSLAPGRLDRQLLDVMVSRHSSGLAILSTPRIPARCLDVSEGIVASVLGLLSKSFDTIVIDLPKTWYPWTDNVVWGSNNIYIVSSFTVPALRQARFVADAVAAKANATGKVSVIVNKYNQSIFGGGLRRKDVERVLGTRLGGLVPDLGDAVSEAINRGLPLSEVSPGSKLEKQLLNILSDVKALR